LHQRSGGKLPGHLISQLFHFGQSARVVGAHLDGHDAGANLGVEHDTPIALPDGRAIPLGHGDFEPFLFSLDEQNLVAAPFRGDFGRGIDLELRLAKGGRRPQERRREQAKQWGAAHD